MGIELFFLSQTIAPHVLQHFCYAIDDAMKMKVEHWRSTHVYFHFVECPNGLLALARKTSLSPCLSRVVVIGHRGF